MWHFTSSNSTFLVSLIDCFFANSVNRVDDLLINSPTTDNRTSLARRKFVRIAWNIFEIFEIFFFFFFFFIFFVSYFWVFRSFIIFISAYIADVFWVWFVFKIQTRWYGWSSAAISLTRSFVLRTISIWSIVTPVKKKVEQWKKKWSVFLGYFQNYFANPSLLWTMVRTATANWRIISRSVLLSDWI